ncbi:MAG TPA: kelch repeat-containing protein, partial [Polyangia bacterium]|nr:kelch repeat-containing protein [Polyangia bacterium]
AEPHALAYDAARARTVLFSGQTGTTNNVPDLWEWDGNAGVWTDRTPATLPVSWPPPLSQHTLVYDSARARMVVLGGRPPGDGTLDSVWEWDGATGAWTEYAPNPLIQDWPLPRWGAAAAYDSERHCVVMVGGATGEGDLFTRQTWEWRGDTAAFTDRTVPAKWPTMREAFAFTFDTDRGKAIVVNGATASTIFRELWEWDGAGDAWTDRTPNILPPTFPGLRSGFPIVYDPDRRLVVTFGPRTSRNLYEWDPATNVWTNRTPRVFPRSWPNTSGPMVYDAKRKRIVMVGAFAAGSAPDPGVRGRVDTWELDPETMVWRVAIGDAPPARVGYDIAYDSRRGSVVLFGGMHPAVDTRFQDLWEWDGGAAKWIDRTPSPLPALWPSVRSGHALAYSAARGRIVLFGGVGALNVGATADTWEWDGATGLWHVYPAAVVWPPARVSHALTYDPARGAVVMFGGGQPPYGVNPTRDLWEWGR